MDFIKTDSRNVFRDQLSEQLTTIANHEGLSLDTPENAGYAFALWVAELFMAWDFALESDLDDSVQRGGGDLGIDIVLEDEGNRVLYIIQAKFRGTSKRPKHIDTDAARSFLTRHEDLMCGESALAKGNSKAHWLLGSYKDRVESGWKVRAYFATTASDNADIGREYIAKNEILQDGTDDIEYILCDTAALRAMYDETAARETSIPEIVEIDFPKDLFFEQTNADYPFLVGLLKGNSIRNEYRKKGRADSLFAWNIRNYLGDRGINKIIKKTAEDEPGHFFYYNNGITAVCKNYEFITGNRLRIQKFQIINGAQTVSSIAKAPERDDVWVLFRLIKTNRVDTESGINQKIIESNNTQNSIRLSDFRSNDPIQKWLKNTITNHKATAVLGKTTYQPKRTGKRGSGRVVKLEEFAKIRHAYLHDPLLVHASPKQLWTERASGGSYEMAFGIDGKIEPNWTMYEVEKALLAIALHDEAIIAAKRERKRDDSMKFMQRLRFHTIALCGLYIEKNTDVHSPHSLLGDKDKFSALWDTLWTEIRSLLNASHRHYVRRDNAPLSLFAYVRNKPAWDGLQEDFKFKFGL